MKNAEFWTALDTLVGQSEIVIDRPKGSAHPRYPDFIYPVDYGYLKNTVSPDGGALTFGSAPFPNAKSTPSCALSIY